MFPKELTAYNQWIVWRYGEALNGSGKPTKLPISPKNGHKAAVDNPDTWTTFEQANVALSSGFFNGLGFVLSENDPYCFIDLDDPQSDAGLIFRQTKIAEMFDTYSEISPSGKGLHIICKAKVLSGRKRDKIEIYSNLHYFTMTGITWQDKPIEDRQWLAHRLWEDLGGADRRDGPVIEETQKYADVDIFNYARAATNGEKFDQLWRGNWQQLYPSPSEADFALINILQFYTRNKEQIKRMFRQSALGQRDKAQKRDKYVNGMITRSFDREVPHIPMEQLKEVALRKINEAKKSQLETLPALDLTYDWKLPPGLVGDIASFIYSAAIRPVQEVALAASIGLMAGICGRQYNISGTGLNQYVMLLAKTGVGKEAASSGIDKLIRRVREMGVPAVTDFVGPAEIASGQALVKYLGKNPCFVSVLGEFGLTLQSICSQHASSPQVTLRKLLLTLFNKSGRFDQLRETIYSDKTNNTSVISCPSFSILGEGTPDTFWPALDESMIAQGLLPRFTCIEYLGGRPPINENHNKVEPSVELLQRLAELAANCLLMADNKRFIEIAIDDDAKQILSAFNVKCDTNINGAELDVVRQLWNRAHIKVLKLAGLLAIGQNYVTPKVTVDDVRWAINLVERDIQNILIKFESGKVGRNTGELNQLDDLKHIIKDYLLRPYEKTLEKYGVMEKMHKERVIPMSYLSRRALVKPSFYNASCGASIALKRAMELLAQDGSIRELRAIDIVAQYNKTLKCYYIQDIDKFL